MHCTAMADPLEKLRRDAAKLGYKLVKIGGQAEKPLLEWTTSIPQGLEIADLALIECPIFAAMKGDKLHTEVRILLQAAGIEKRWDLLVLSPCELRDAVRANVHRDRGALGVLGIKRIDQWRTVLIRCAGAGRDGQQQIRPELMAEALSFMDEYHADLAKLADA
jgi:hypothetical protein